MGNNKSTRTKSEPEIDPKSESELRKARRIYYKEKDEFLASLICVPYQVNLEEKRPNTTRFVVASDTHNQASQIPIVPAGDVFIHAGDFTDWGTAEETNEFKSFLTGLPHAHKVFIVGNHDKLLLDPLREKEVRAFFADENCTFLNNEQLTINGINIYGISWIKNTDISSLQTLYSLIPKETDVLVTHNPPLGYGDMVMQKHTGDYELAKAVKNTRPRYHVFGHVHENPGIQTDEQTVYVNAAVCNRQLVAVNVPIVFDIENK